MSLYIIDFNYMYIYENRTLRRNCPKEGTDFLITRVSDLIGPETMSPGSGH